MNIKFQHIKICYVQQKRCFKEQRSFPGDLVVKKSACQAGDTSSTPGLGGSFREGNGSPLQDSCPGSPWTEEPGGLQSAGSQRGAHDLENKQQQWQRRKCIKENV